MVGKRILPGVERGGKRRRMGKVEEKAAGKRTFFLPQGARREFLPTGSIPGVRAQGNPMGMKGRKFWEGKKFN